RVQRPHIGDGLVRVYHAQLSLGRRGQRRRVAVSTNDKRHEWVGQFRVREVGGRLRFVREATVLHVADDADDLRRIRFIKHIDGDVLSDWVFSWEVLPRQRLADEYDVPRLPVLDVREVAATQDG